MKTQKYLWVALFLCGFSSLGSAQSDVDTFLSRFNGAWQGSGKAFGMPARLEMKWEWVLGNRFLRLSLKNDMRGENGRGQVFEGHAYYQPAATSSAGSTSATSAAKIEATWFDSRGVTFPIKAHAEGDALVALWGSPEKEQGKSVYRILEPGKMEVVDSVLQKDGTWREFGRFVLLRQ